MRINHEQIREEIVQIGREMLNSSLVVGTWGNISARVPGKNYIAITPSGVDYNCIDASGIVVMDMEGNIIEGDMKPSIEFGLHLAIYNNREDVNAIVHTHSTYCTAMAIARKPIPGACEDLVQIVGGDVRVSTYALPGTLELGDNTVKALKDRNAVILANHGCLGAGKNLRETLKIVNVVEKSAKATIFAQLMGGVVELSKEDIDIMRDFYLNKYGQ
ncbi:MAG: class II aldolase [Alkaliphilus sp.]|jgi:L-fuculose-phosphate aldolase|nr:class II aldolase/adducin family protein [Alkaliphilus sp. AH-315-G20]MBN4069497.1 class II aldolase/adducin family protein [bacterium AH-315-G05]PHS36267.1 MAG: class II aldolase [Alkaliphilus sp.]